MPAATPVTPPVSEPARQRVAGFTLVEAVLTMVIVSVAVLAVGQALAFAFSHQSDGLWQIKAAALAESYAEEIAARRYDEAAPVGGVPPCAPAAVPCTAVGRDAESRSEFDDVDDYHALDEMPPVDPDGMPRADYAGYRVQVSVAYLSGAQVTSFGLDDVTDGKLVTITVTAPGQRPMAFPLLRANY